MSAEWRSRIVWVVAALGLGSLFGYQCARLSEKQWLMLVANTTQHYAERHPELSKEQCRRIVEEVLEAHEQAEHAADQKAEY